uniref:PGG domain-containing protein n=1 Tax=Kalanchoe fedtschenkoi TaxID=63787 RepID=A0A7N0TJE2_KALFE
MCAAPLLKDVKNEKLNRHHAKKLVKCLCTEAAVILEKSSDAALLFKMPLLLAAENGIHEIVKQVTYSFPDAIWYYDNNNSEIFRLAIRNRHHEVYNLLYDMGDLYTNIVRQSVENGENILHLAGYLAPPDRLRIVSGAALQMQRELQWFKEIESLVQPAYKNKRNIGGKTPQEIFTASHKKLMEDGEKWMRETATATSCMVAVVLIATIVFTAAITVPGGNNGNNGKPMLGSERAFVVFGVLDALSLFTSSISILMFLSILTSRYAESDFLRA